MSNSNEKNTNATNSQDENKKTTNNQNRSKKVDNSEKPPVKTHKITADLGNANYKLIVGDKRIINVSNVQEVKSGTFGAYEVNKKTYLFGENAKTKKSTNKICPTKKALLGKALYPVVEDNSQIELTTLLPLSLYINATNKQKYTDLLKGRYTVSNQYGAKKTFTVTKVEVCCESFSSLVTENSLLQEPLYLIDLGGVDLSGIYVNRTPDISKKFTKEKGMNILYSELAGILTGETLESYSEQDAKHLLDNYDTLEQELKDVIDNFIDEYIEENIMEPLKEIGYKSIIHKLAFTGGGSKDLERYLLKKAEKSKLKITILKDSVFSNAEGARLISMRRGN